MKTKKPNWSPASAPAERKPDPSVNVALRLSSFLHRRFKAAYESEGLTEKQALLLAVRTFIRASENRKS